MGISKRHWGIGAIAPLLLAVFVSTAVAAEPGIKDDGGFFSPDAVNRATEQLKSLKSKNGRTVVIETTAALPAELQGRVDGNEASKGQAYSAYVQQRTYSTGADVYLFVNRTPPRIEAHRREANRSGLSQTQQETLVKDLANRFRAKDFDGGLAGFVSSLEGGLSKADAAAPVTAVPPPAAPPANARRAPDATGEQPKTAERGAGIGSYLCFGIVGLLLLFVVVSVIKRLIGGGRQGPPPLQGGQPGYGQPGYGGNYGQGGYGNQGGGGGFGRGIGGGILGGLLGSWIGSNVFGQSNTPTDNANSGSDNGAGPIDTGGSSGADFGDSGSSSGSDFGGGDSGGSSGSDF